MGSNPLPGAAPGNSKSEIPVYLFRAQFGRAAECKRSHL